MGSNNDNNNPQPPTTPPPATPPANGGNNDPAWTKDRSEQAKRAGQRSLLQSFGLDVPKDADAATIQKMVDDLKGKLDEHKTLKQAQLTESERSNAALKEAQDKLTGEAAARKAAEDRAKELEAARLTDTVDGAIKEAAQKAGAKNLKHVLKLIRDDHAEAVEKLANDKGEIDEKAAEKLVTDFRTANPTYFGGNAGPGSPSNRNAQKPAGPPPKKIGPTFKL